MSLLKAPDLDWNHYPATAFERHSELVKSELVIVADVVLALPVESAASVAT